jgi:acetyl esterase
MKFCCFIFVCALFSPLVRAEDKSDLTYDTAAGEEVKLDLSVPDGPGRFPVCILIHGGGFERGDKQEQV